MHHEEPAGTSEKSETRDMALQVPAASKSWMGGQWDTNPSWYVPSILLVLILI